ncbi:IS701 family transposase [Dactylosporangium sp. NPDC051541]|uniref:IS701 family transposase n=1 Tax=Dactylosporangium sp. NPDC051541 TaxID=3363977 RepID=UPI00378FE224
MAGRFGRVEPRRQARTFLLGLLSDVDSRNCWSLAEQSGDVSPRRMQRLLGEAVWDAGKVRDDLRGYVAATLGDPQGVLVLDDTGDLKKGADTVGVQRQYTGTAGRIENAQVAVFLAYATAAGRALIDRELYLPRSWTDDRARCAAAGVPDDVGFATKTVLGRRMLARAFDAGIPAAWVTADEAYGGDQSLRKDLQHRGIGYVLAVAKSHHVVIATAGEVRADTVVADLLPSRAWQRLSAGAGAKGERDYDWAWISITAPAAEQPGQHALLVRRRISDGELAYYRCYSPEPVTLKALVRVAGIRWMVEECFQAGKGETGLDQHQVRRWKSWHRYTTLVMLAHAILTAITVTAGATHDPADDLIPLTVNEIRHLFAKLVLTPTRTAAYWLTWSDWRRRHQARAKISHYRRRQTIDNHA